MSYPIADRRPVAALADQDRAEFLGRVYSHLTMAVGVFIALETALFMGGMAEWLYNALAGSRAGWLLILGGFMIVSWMATSAANDILNPQKQYLGLFAMAFAEAIIFAPFLFFVFTVRGAGTVVSAAVITLVGFAGLTAVGLLTRKDLSFVRPMLLWGGMLALVAIFGALVFGFELGTWFSVAMIGLAGGSILYNTQNIMRRYPSGAYVGAALQLFASLMMMFWYVLRLLARR